MSEFLDELARAVARPVPRSRALRLLGGVFVAAAVPALRPTTARPAPARRFRPTADCDVALCDTCSTGRLCCVGIVGNDGMTRCVRGCCKDTEICCKAPRLVTCCTARTHTCGPLGLNDTPTCACILPCPSNEVCCDPVTQECATFRYVKGGRLRQGCRNKCKQGERRCASTARLCCPSTRACCGETCCAAGQECVHGLDASGRPAQQCTPKCRRNEKRCNFTCCRPSQKKVLRRLPSGRRRCVCVNQ